MLQLHNTHCPIRLLSRLIHLIHQHLHLLKQRFTAGNNQRTVLTVNRHRHLHARGFITSSPATTVATTKHRRQRIVLLSTPAGRLHIRLEGVVDNGDHLVHVRVLNSQSTRLQLPQ